MERETEKKVTRAVNQDYEKHCRVTDTKKFMLKLLPVPDGVIKTVRKEMETSGFYLISRWVDFLDLEDRPMEDAGYKAFIKS